MTAHRLFEDQFLAARSYGLVEDPGSAGYISVGSKSGARVELRCSASAETRTLNRPDVAGILVSLDLVYTAGGAITITVTGGYDQAGGTSLVFSDNGDNCQLRSVDVNGTLRWQVVSYDGITGPTIEQASYDVDTLTVDTGITVAAATSGTTNNLIVGTFASTADGSGSILSTTRTANVRFYADDGGVALGASGSVPDIRNVLSRVLVTESATSNHIRLASIMGHIKGYAATGDLGIWNTEQVAGVYGYMELVRASGTATYGGYGKTAAVLGCVETSGTIAVDTNHILAGVAAISKLTSDLTQTGKCVAFLADIYDTTNWSDSTARSKWGWALYAPAKAVAAGICLGDFAASAASGSGLTFSATATTMVRVYGEATSDLTNAYNCRTILGRHLLTHASAVNINQETYGVTGQLVCKNATLLHLHAGVTGTFEVTTAATVNAAYTYGVAGVMARLGVGTSITTATKAVCGFSAVYNGGALASGNAFAYGATSTTATTWTALLAADKCDAILYVATATNYESGVKAVAATPADNTSHAIKISIGGTPAYIPAYAAETF